MNEIHNQQGVKMYNKHFIPLLIILVIGLPACNKTAPQSSIESYSSFASVESFVQEEIVTESQSEKADEFVSANAESSAIVEENAESSVADTYDFFNQPVKFTDGAGLAEPVTLAVGDSFLGWKVISYQGTATGSRPLVCAFVEFEGTAQVKGTLEFAPDDDLDNHVLRFYITDDVYAKMIPTAVGDERNYIWFVLNDSEDTQKLIKLIQSTCQPKLTMPYSDERYQIEDCEIIIKEYYYVYMASAATDSADLVEAICIPGIDLS